MYNWKISNNLYNLMINQN